MNDEIAVVTHHEAGHAVAALMTVVGDLDGSVTATLLGGKGTGNAHVASGVTSVPVQAAFIFYAGPWAEARVQWVKSALDCLDDWGSPEKVDTVNLLPGRLSARARS
jgi:hypothetical protein